MKLQKTYQYRDRHGRPTDTPSQGGSKDVIDEYIVLTPGERKVFTYLTVVITVGLLLLQLGALLHIFTDWGVRGANGVLNPLAWGWKAFWFTVIGLITMPITALAGYAVLKQTWFIQKDRIEEAQKTSTALVRRQTENDELRHRARQALVVAAESDVYEAINNGKAPDHAALKTLEAASREHWTNLE